VHCESGGALLARVIVHRGVLAPIHVAAQWEVEIYSPSYPQLSRSCGTALRFTRNMVY